MAIRPSEELIVDRKQSDITNKTNKGNYNKEDFNRIQHWQIYLRDLLNEYGYYCNISPHEDWVTIDPRQSDVDKIKNDTNALKDAYFVLSTTPTTTAGINKINTADANAIEKILYDIDYLIDSMSKYFIYCGVAVCGSNRVWQQKFRRY